MKIKERLAILLSIAILLSACSGTGTNADNDNPSDTKIPSASALAPPTLYTPAPPDHPFFYLLKYKVDKTLPPETEFSFLLMKTKSNNPFTKDTEDQVIRRKAGDGGNISAMMIQAGDETERIYDASGTQSSGTFNMPNFSNRQTGAAAPADLKYSKSLRLLKPDTDYHLYVRVNNAAPIKLTSIKTAPLPAASGNAHELQYDLKAATADSTLTLSTRNTEPFYPMAPLLLWSDGTTNFLGLTWERIDYSTATTDFMFTTNTNSITISSKNVIVKDTDFVNLRYVDAALKVTGMPKPANNAQVYWFDTDVAHKGWPTISLKQEFLAENLSQRFSTYKVGGFKSSFEQKVLH